MSTERSSSAVRNLRSIFESKESESQASEARAHSGSRAASREGRSRPLSKVRSSFVAVERPSMASTTEQTDGGELERVSSASLRRQSFSENDENRESLEAFKKTVSQDSERRGRESSIQETIPEVAVESAVNTPALEIKEHQAFGVTPKTSSKLNTVSQVQDNGSSDFSTTNAEAGTETQPAESTELTPASDEAALKTKTNTDAPVPIPENKPSATLSNGSKQHPRPSNILPKKAPKPSVESPKSPASVKSATSSLAHSAKAAVKDLSRKISRSSLTAPTAASNARASGYEKSESTASSKAPPPAKREPTKVANVSAHLLAPTAASRARRDQEVQAKASSEGRTAKTAPKSNSIRSTPRHSLAASTRPESGASQGTKKVAAPDSGFLDRMMRPTAASQSRAQEKVESKPAPRRAAPVHKKAISTVSGQPSTDSGFNDEKMTSSTLVDVAEESNAEPSSDSNAAQDAIIAEPEVATVAEESKHDAAPTSE